MSIILSTHNVRQAHRLADEVVNLHMGRIWPSDMVNLFRGELERTAGKCLFRTSSICITLPENSGQVSYIAVNPTKITLLTTQPGNAMENVFEGRVTRIEKLNASVLVTVDIGERLVVEIDREKLAGMDISIDCDVWVGFDERAMHAF